MTKECMAMCFQVNLSFPNTSHLCLKGTYILVKVSVLLNDSEGILLAGAYSRRNGDLVEKHP